MILIIGAFLGFFSVAFGAYSEHGLKPVVSEEEFRFLMTAIRYNQVNAVLITLIGFVLTSTHALANVTSFKWSARLFILGSFLFSFSIYLSVWLGIKQITYFTPVGGTILMLAWGFLCYSGFKLKRNI